MDWVIFWRNFIDEIADHIANLSKRGATGAGGSISDGTSLFVPVAQSGALLLRCSVSDCGSAITDLMTS